jgi:REP element-mobilizing transposase RayT
MRQTSFGFLKDYKKEFGGSLLQGKRKSKRPLSTKSPIHLILKANQKGVFNPTSRELKLLIRETAKKFNIQLYDLALNWSHIHFLIRIKDRQDHVRFIRALCSLITATLKFKEKLFTLRPFTRVLSWGRDLKYGFNYLIINQMESFGLIRRTNSKKKPRRGKQLH